VRTEESQPEHRPLVQRADVERLLRFAQTYQQRNPDLLYRIYTKYLTPRPL